jgi:valyl-tRNA synthetase
MTENNIPKTYDPKAVEDKWYSFWLENEYFKPVIEGDKTPFTIVIPPPNVTGELHLGHALNNTVQDVLIRMKRMQGYPTLWLPGTDHAGIATEAKVKGQIAEEGLTKYDLGREKFIEKVWAWKEKYGNRITNQLKKLGVSCDWSRERFTMDEGCSKAVKEVFVRLYERGLIYKGNYIINWCPICKTTLSDIEVEHEEKPGNLWHIKYPIKDSDRFITVATTRPETMLGDTAIAVHPDDERYSELIGKTAVLPILNREIPIIADEYIDKEFGTGAVKVTPAHDPNDFDMGVRHNLPRVVVIDFDGNMTKEAGPYEGMERYKCRKKLVEDLKEQDFLEKIEDHSHNVGQCYRCDTVVEPLVSAQWFVNMKPLAEPAIDVVKEGKVKFVPERFTKLYLNWMENIKDWCISRQLWWGHRIPAWYCECGEIVVLSETPDFCPNCKSTILKQDEDVLDTWFSSALWPFSTLGWPDDTHDLKTFYPTSVLVTGYDIIFFWVARMIFSGLKFMDEIPFEHVVITGLIRDAEGRKMSKSLGNGVDPLEVIEKFGADTLRFTLLTGNTPGNDIRFKWDRVESSRNFANKIWNASRFVLMNLEDGIGDSIGFSKLKKEDKWILSRYNTLVKEATQGMDRFELGLVAQKLYDFIWSEYCDWYIEMVKPRLYDGQNQDDKKAAQRILVYVLSNTLKLLHPYMPFLTEEIWQHLPHEGESIMISKWPDYKGDLAFEKDERDMDIIMDAIRNIRNIRAEMNVAPSKRCPLYVIASNEDVKELFNAGKDYMGKLAGISNVSFVNSGESMGKAVSTVVTGAELLMPLEDLIDFDSEIKRLQKEKDDLVSEVKRAEGKLSNQGFIAKAPKEVIETEKAKLEDYKEKLSKVDERLKTFMK